MSVSERTGRDLWISANSGSNALDFAARSGTPNTALAEARTAGASIYANAQSRREGFLQCERLAANLQALRALPSQPTLVHRMQAPALMPFWLVLGGGVVVSVILLLVRSARRQTLETRKKAVPFILDYLLKNPAANLGQLRADASTFNLDAEVRAQLGEAWSEMEACGHLKSARATGEAATLVRFASERAPDIAKLENPEQAFEALLPEARSIRPALSKDAWRGVWKPRLDAEQTRILNNIQTQFDTALKSTIEDGKTRNHFLQIFESETQFIRSSAERHWDYFFTIPLHMLVQASFIFPFPWNAAQIEIPDTPGHIDRVREFIRSDPEFQDQLDELRARVHADLQPLAEQMYLKLAFNFIKQQWEQDIEAAVQNGQGLETREAVFLREMGVDVLTIWQQRAQPIVERIAARACEDGTPIEQAILKLDPSFHDTCRAIYERTVVEARQRREVAEIKKKRLFSDKMVFLIYNYEDLDSLLSSPDLMKLFDPDAKSIQHGAGTPSLEAREWAIELWKELLPAVQDEVRTKRLVASNDRIVEADRKRAEAERERAQAIRQASHEAHLREQEERADRSRARRDSEELRRQIANENNKAAYYDGEAARLRQAGKDSSSLVRNALEARARARDLELQLLQK